MADKLEGLGVTPRAQWPKQFGAGDTTVIDQLRPGSDNHKIVLEYLLSRLNDSERAMSKFYPRWTVSEKKVQAYIDLPDWEKALEEINRTGQPPKIVSLSVPYSFATISTIVTFLIMAFTNKDTMFQVAAKKQEAVGAARNMEQIHQYNATHTRLIKQLFQFFRDGETYGLACLRLAWRDQKAVRTVRTKKVELDGEGQPTETWEASRELRTVYQGNEIVSWDPFMLFPDPRVPIAEVNKKGEYVFWRSFDGLHMLLRQEEEGNYKWVRNAGKQLPVGKHGGNESARSLRSQGEPTPGAALRSGQSLSTNYIQVDQGTIEIIPKELGLGSKEFPEKWLFTILNKKQIVQAVPFDADHGMHPVSIAEPYSMGYGFGNMGMADFLGPLQDTISWFINSHFDNVRRSLNDIFVVDPSMVEMQDLKRPGPGGYIRLKKAAFGRDVRSALTQLNVHDVTGGHVKDAELMMLIGQRLSAVSDNLSGVNESGGRRTATEVRTRSGGALSRLQSQAKIYSAMAIMDLTEQQTLNVQQYMDHEFFMEVVGSNGQPEGIVLDPSMLVGDFHYPVHDGTLPIDKIALLDMWRQLLIAMQSDPVLRQTYSIPQVFGFIAELGGIVNLESFKITARPDGEIEQELQAGNMLAGSVGSNGGGAGGAGTGGFPAQLSQLLGGSGGAGAARSPVVG